MSTLLAAAHIQAQQRIRDATAGAVASVWSGLPAYNEAQLDEWLTRVLPVIEAGQRTSVAATEAFLAHALRRAPIGMNPAEFVGAAVRAGTPPEDVYQRAFVTVWTALKAGDDLHAAIAAGLARATGTARTDVQLTMRATLRGVGEADDLILGYQRVPDGGACDFCLACADLRYRVSDLLPIHNRCGCGVDVITGRQRPRFSGLYANDIPTAVEGVSAAVRQHGELGPVLVNAAHTFTSQDDLP